jgi:Methyltransferase domain
MGLKQSSRARLTRFTVDDFPGDSLRDALGRVVSGAECLPRKEFFESWEVARRVRRRFRGGSLLEVAAGHGLLSWIMLLLDDSSPGAVCVDRRRPESFGRLEAALVARWPRLAGRVRFEEAHVEVDRERGVHLSTGAALEVGPETLVTSVHGCGQVTDRTLDLALAARARVAVLPCCQAVSISDTAGLEGWLEGRLAVDVTRLFRLRAAGYAVTALTIPEQITPQNRLLLGAPVEPPQGGTV